MTSLNGYFWVFDRIWKKIIEFELGMQYLAHPFRKAREPIRIFLKQELKKKTAFRRLASLGIISAQLKVPLKPCVLSQQYRIKRFTGALNCFPNMPKDVSLMESWYNFFPVWIETEFYFLSISTQYEFADSFIFLWTSFGRVHT